MNDLNTKYEEMKVGGHFEDSDDDDEIEFNGPV